MHEIEQMDSDELVKLRREIRAQITTLQERADAITGILNRRSVATLKRDADKCLRDRPSYADFRRKLDAIQNQTNYENPSTT